MANLRTYQDDFKKLLFVRESEATQSAVWGSTLPDRLKVYRNNTRTNWADTLDCDFAMTRTQFEIADWENLRKAYFVKHPPQHWELNTSMQPFVQFIAGQKVPAPVKELADFEWHDLKIFIDRTEVRNGLGITNPTAVVRVFQHQIFDWVELKAPRQHPPRQKPEVLVFYRDSRNTCHIREADPLMLLAMDHFRKPGAALDRLEAVRRKLLPQSTVPLDTVIDHLKEMEILL
jgi:hypothetical protein